jgi:hypothetical protein
MAGEVLMRAWLAAAVAIVAVLILVPVVPGQSLAEVAARNRKKEQEKGKPAKVYTEDDLRGRAASSGSMSQMDGPVNAVVASPSPGAPGASPAPGAPKAKTEDEERAERETEWRGRLQHANSEVARLSAEIDRAQTALNDISGPLYGGTRASLIAKVEEGQRQLAAAKQSVLDIQEEGRRARFRE